MVSSLRERTHVDSRWIGNSLLQVARSNLTRGNISRRNSSRTQSLTRTFNESWFLEWADEITKDNNESWEIHGMTMSPEGDFTSTGTNMGEVPHESYWICESDDHRALQLKMYYPKTEWAGNKSKLPVIVSIQGTAFDGEEIFVYKDGTPRIPMGLPLTYRGYAVAHVDFRGKEDGGQFPAQLHDIKAAVRWIRQNAESLNVDPDRICPFGESSGGWASAMLAVLSGSGGQEFRSQVDLEGSVCGNSNISSNVTAAVAFYPVTDMLQMDDEANQSNSFHNKANSPESEFMGFSIQEDPARVQLSNPVNYVAADTVPLMIRCGNRDTSVPYLQSTLLADELKEVGAQYDFEVIEGADHGESDHWKTQALWDEVAEFLDSYCVA